MNQQPFEVDDAIVLLLGAPSSVPSLKDRLEGVTRLEKLLFLLEHETDLGGMLTEQPAFKPHHFGPFSEKIYQAVETLANAGLVKDSAVRSSGLVGSEDSWEAWNIVGNESPNAAREFELTPKGRQYYTALLKDLPSGVEGLTSKFKEQFGVLPLRQLIRYVYTRYPEFTTKSKIRANIMGQ